MTTVRHSVAATGTDSGGGKISKNAWNADHVVTGPAGIDYDISPNPTADDQEFKSALSGWTTVGSPTVLDANATGYNSLLRLSHTATGTFQIHGLVRAIPAMPFTVTARIPDYLNVANYQQHGFILTDGTKYFFWGPLFQSTNGIPEMVAANWTNRTTRSGTFTEYTGTRIDRPKYLRMVVNSSTSVDLWWSVDGLVWPAPATAWNPNMTIASIGFGITGNDNSTAASMVVDWMRFGTDVIQPEARIWQSVGAGGDSLSHSYKGKDAVGASTFTPTAARIYLKKITLTNPGLITSVGTYVFENGGSAQVSSLPGVGIWTDNAGSPDRLVAHTPPGPSDSWYPANDASPDSTDGRWAHVPIGYYAVAGSYWVGVVIYDVGFLKVAYDAGSGSDRYISPGGGWLIDATGGGGVAPVTTTTDDYSIRASVLDVSGLGDDPVAALFGTPDTAFEFNTSSLAGLTALGTPTAEDANTTVPGCYYVKKAGTTAQPQTGRYVAATPPFTAITKVVDCCTTGENYIRHGILGIMNSTPSVAQSIERFFNSSRYIWAGVNYGSLTGSPSPLGTDRTCGDALPFYLAVVANSSTSVEYYVSNNGRLWRKHVAAQNPGFTPAKVFISIFPENSQSLDAFAAYDYLRIWNSVKTFPGGV